MDHTDDIRALKAYGDMPPDDDRPHPSGDDRYAIYVVAPGRLHFERHHFRVATTSEQGVGLTLRTLNEEGQTTNDTRVGLFDRETRRWVINPWAVGRE